MSFWNKLGKVLETGVSIAQEIGENAQREHDRRSRIEQRRTESAAYQHGRDDFDTAIVLSAPGRHEEVAGKPAARGTGKTLNRTLSELHKADPVRFPSKNTDDYRIVNASDEVHYKGKTGRTEASDASLKSKENKQRLRKSLSDKGSIVALGKKADQTLRHAGIEPTHSGSHPSMQNINRNFSAVGGTPKERSDKRISEYAKEISESGKSSKKMPKK